MQSKVRQTAGFHLEEKCPPEAAWVSCLSDEWTWFSWLPQIFILSHSDRLGSSWAPIVQGTPEHIVSQLGVRLGACLQVSVQYLCIPPGTPVLGPFPWMKTDACLHPSRLSFPSYPHFDFLWPLTSALSSLTHWTKYQLYNQTDYILIWLLQKQCVTLGMLCHYLEELFPIYSPPTPNQKKSMLLQKSLHIHKDSPKRYMRHSYRGYLLETHKNWAILVQRWEGYFLIHIFLNF